MNGTQYGLANVPECEHSRGGICEPCSVEFGMLVSHPVEDGADLADPKVDPDPQDAP